MHSSSRNGAKVIWLALHTTEGIMRATALRDWTSWPGSSHASSDETGTLLGPADGFVPYDRAAWTLRNGNPISENIEQCGWAKWSRAEWLSRPKLLEATARWLAERSAARGIPLVKLSPADVKARKPGVLGHGDYSTGTGDGTHWDPGPNYPWDVVLGRAQQIRNGGMTAVITEEDFMPALSDTEQRELLARVRDTSVAVDYALVPEDGFNSKGEDTKRLRGIQADTGAIRTALNVQSGAIDALTKLVADDNDLDLDAVRAAVREEMAKVVDVQVTVKDGAAG